MSIKKIHVPDLGGVDAVTVMEWLVESGQRVEVDQALVTLETEKASMEVPSPSAGVVGRLLVQKGDQIQEGAAMLEFAADGEASAVGEVQSGSVTVDGVGMVAGAEAQSVSPQEKDYNLMVTGDDQSNLSHGEEACQVLSKVESQHKKEESLDSSVYAGPSVRRLARELAIDLRQVPASGAHGRISKEDIHAYITQRMQQTASDTQVLPFEDPARFGKTSTSSLSKIKTVTAQRLSASWQQIPQVTQCDTVDIEDLENVRQQFKSSFSEKGVRLTMLSFVIKALALAFKEHPSFNSAYDARTNTLHIRHYVHIGVAVDTPGGLLVPVLREVDAKSIYEISSELQALSQKARDGHCLPMDMKGASMSVSSLGGIGGDYFTPIVNPPQVAILGVSQARKRPVWDESQGVFVPRLLLPLSLSYDHRVIDGAEALRFLNTLMHRLSVPSLTQLI